MSSNLEPGTLDYYRDEWHKALELACTVNNKLKSMEKERDQALDRALSLRDKNQGLETHVARYEKELAEAKAEIQRLSSPSASLRAKAAAMTDKEASAAIANLAAALGDHEACDNLIDAAEAELERWRHGVPVEGDYVCPNALRADMAAIELLHLRVAVKFAGSHGGICHHESCPDAAAGHVTGPCKCGVTELFKLIPD